MYVKVERKDSKIYLREIFLLKGLSEITTFAKTEMLLVTCYLCYLEPTSDRETSSMNNTTKGFLGDICNCPLFDLSFPLLGDLFTPYPLFQSFFPWKPAGMCLMLTGLQFCWREMLLTV